MIVFFMIRLAMILVRATWVAPIDMLPTDEAFEHGVAMVAASSREVTEYEIDRVARHESGYWMDARPHMRRWPHDAANFPPRCRTLKSGRRQCGYVCGIMQATAETAAECVSWILDPFKAYRAGADSVRRWHRTCVRMGKRGKARYRCARAGYAHGTEAARNS